MLGKYPHFRSRTHLKIAQFLLILILLSLSACQSEVETEEVAAVPATPVLATFTPTPPPTHTPTPKPTATPTPKPTATTKVSTTTKTDVTAGATQKPSRFTAVITEEQVNVLARQALGQQDDIPISNVRVDLKPGHIVFTGRVVLAILPINIEIVATITVEDGKPIPQIESVKAGGNEVRGLLRQQVDNLIEPYLTQLAETDLNVYIETVQITEDTIEFQGHYLE